MHGVGSSERTFSTSCVSKYVFKASSMSLAVFQRRRHSSAYLIKVHWRRYAYNRINCFWCERAWALAVLSAWLKVSHPSFPLFAFSIASAALSHLSGLSWNISVICNIVTRKTKYNSCQENTPIEAINIIRNSMREKIREKILKISSSRENIVQPFFSPKFYSRNALL